VIQVVLRGEHNLWVVNINLFAVALLVDVNSGNDTGLLILLKEFSVHSKSLLPATVEPELCVTLIFEKNDESRQRGERMFMAH
jgi:hypothetical protein